MIRLPAVALAVALVLVLSGCPFEARVALEAPQRRGLDPALLGYWVHENSRADEQPALLLVMPFNDSEYFAELRPEREEPMRWRVYGVAIGGHEFLSINELKPAPSVPAFLLARAAITADQRLVVRLVGEQVPKNLADNAKGLADYIAEHADDPALDDEAGPLVFRRARADEIKSGRP